MALIKGLEGGTATVSGSAVTISGTADDASVIQAAEQAVIAATGAERVNNEIVLSLDLQDRTRGATNRITQRIESRIGYLPVIPIALLVLLVFALLAWLLGRIRWPYTRFTQNPFLQDIIRKLTQTGIMLSGVLLALDILDAMALVGGVLGAAGVAGIAIGFAFKDLIENDIASILLSLRQPFRSQDHVLIDGHEGLVTAMNTRTTVLTTFDGNVVRIPNATVFKTTIINYTSDPRRRFGFAVGVGADVDLTQAIEVGTRTLAGTQGVLPEPKPLALITKLATQASRSSSSAGSISRAPALPRSKATPCRMSRSNTTAWASTCPSRSTQSVSRAGRSPLHQPDQPPRSPARRSPPPCWRVAMSAAT